MRTRGVVLGVAWAAASVLLLVFACAFFLPPGCQWDRYSVRCGRACLQLESCYLASPRLSCERVPGDRLFQSGAWDDGAGAVPSGHVTCVTEPSEACLGCVNAGRCDELGAGRCHAECGELEAPRPAKPIPIRR